MIEHFFQNISNMDFVIAAMIVGYAASTLATMIKAVYCHKSTDLDVSKAKRNRLILKRTDKEPDAETPETTNKSLNLKKRYRLKPTVIQLANNKSFGTIYGNYKLNSIIRAVNRGNSVSIKMQGVTYQTTDIKVQGDTDHKTVTVTLKKKPEDKIIGKRIRKNGLFMKMNG